MFGQVPAIICMERPDWGNISVDFVHCVNRLCYLIEIHVLGKSYKLFLDCE